MVRMLGRKVYLRPFRDAVRCCRDSPDARIIDSGLPYGSVADFFWLTLRDADGWFGVKFRTLKRWGEES